MKIAILAVLCLLASPGSAQDEHKLLAERRPDEIGRLIQEAAKVPEFGKRIEDLSRAYLGVPFKWGPLGEGAGRAGAFDGDPLMDFSSVDCVTFVEQTMAMARARDLKSMQRELNRIRYKDGKISYASRNHFPELDWLPNNIAAGYLKDATGEIAGTDVKTATKTIKKRDWYLAKSTSNLEGPDAAALGEDEKARRARAWRALGEGFQDETASIPYLPMDKLPAHLDAVPSGAVVSIVREDNPKMPVLISHQGFFIRKDGVPYFRHASFNAKVIDVPFLEYFYKYYGSSWRVVGLNVALPLPAR
ncbi:MAG: DUF1460 domain-containing protein [Elusimicrobia bacterium]|nr:DUF1460 domain-containing protein [Elusimicrobiota bacterium]